MRLAFCLIFYLNITTYSCSDDTEFAGDHGGKAGLEEENSSQSDDAKPAEEEPTPAETDDPTQAPIPSECDLDSEFVEIQFPEKIQACIDSGNIYDFYTQSCSPIKKSSSFECSFDGVKDVLNKLGISTNAIENAIDKNAKLIGCGEKREGLSIITQWWYPSEESIDEQNCSFDSTTVITTGCFQFDNGDGTQTEASTPEEQSEIIKECLK